MADFDRGWDEVDAVKDAAVAAVKNILQMELNEHQAPNWLQAAEAIWQMRSLLNGYTATELEKECDAIIEQWDDVTAKHWSRLSRKYLKALKRLREEIESTVD